jgi:predicted transcriptional regulator
MKAAAALATFQDNGVEQMKAADVMVSNVITVSAEASVQEVGDPR